MSRDGRPVYRRQYTAVDYILAFSFLIIVAFVFFFVTEVAFEKTGFTRFQFLLILAVALLGSYVDIPVWRIKNTRPTVVVREVRAFWITYRIPQYAMTQVTTTVALNVGGAIVPIVVSGILLNAHHSIWQGVLVATLLTTIAVHAVAKYEAGVGIVAPTLLPPIAAVLFSLPFVAMSNLAITAYIAGTLGTLMGADLSNLGKISEGGTHVASIGGAGKFDGIFLTGIVAVLIASLI
ncbi:MAG TPA: DUF1614 domain-containing protein [Nitrososphaerales archaeon]|nr:DUF1614 domain-containing protein [Nitrososphaerales archaeon]